MITFSAAARCSITFCQALEHKDSRRWLFTAPDISFLAPSVTPGYFCRRFVLPPFQKVFVVFRDGMMPIIASDDIHHAATS